MAENDLFAKDVRRSALNSSPLRVGGGVKKTRRKTEVIELNPVDEYRRVFGVYQLMQQMGTEKPKPGHSYHIISGGHVDLLAHLQWVLLLWKKVRRVFISAWAISSADILLCAWYLENGTVGKLELLLGDIFPSKYKMEWKKLMELYDEGKITDVFTSTIHSKVLLIETDDGTKIAVESSANCNMNPRIEQSCVTVSRRLFDFYYYYLHEVLESEDARYTARQAIKRQTENGLKTEISDDERSALLGQDRMGDGVGG